MQERSLCMVLLWLFFNNRWRISLTLRIAVSDNSEDPIWLGYSSKILNTSWGCTRTSLLLCDLKMSGCRGSFWSWANLNQRGRGISLGNFCILPLPTGSSKTGLLKAILFFFFFETDVLGTDDILNLYVNCSGDWLPQEVDSLEIKVQAAVVLLLSYQIQSLRSLSRVMGTCMLWPDSLLNKLKWGQPGVS